jgi:hypothetical protein
VREYEFTEGQNEIFAKLARSLKVFATQFGVFSILLMFLGLVFILRGDTEGADAYTSIAGGAGIILLGGLMAVMCLRLLKPVGEFREIISTKGHDIDALMSGLDRLASAHRTLRFTLILLLLGSALAVYRVLT